MKKHLALLLVTVLVLTSCKIDDYNPPNFYLDIVPIESVVVPDEFTLGEEYEIFVTYNRPSDCYEFNDFIFQTNFNERTVAVVNTVYTDEVCTPVSEQVEVSFEIFVSISETYVFKFYQGQDNNGNDLYYIVEVPVVE
ncbi:MAG: hypothetical protein HKN99_00270 [Winogradskyella sp.]|nr:hypothetical protein [Winogradskyella sp.]MBT8376884.1 hypothetical protein [Bacteroidia bacterium]NNC44298.1 hypothetical protein [Winogradskyella sp.]NNF86639.1 hypothetical protein [Winogradskyella sp.]NNK40984.1 hypothetical protein [Winogradskyella sp.]